MPSATNLSCSSFYAYAAVQRERGKRRLDRLVLGKTINLTQHIFTSSSSSVISDTIKSSSNDILLTATAYDIFITEIHLKGT